MKVLITTFFLLALPLAAQDISGRWTGTADTIEIKGTGREMTGLLVEHCGSEHLRSYLELKQGHLTGRVWALHDAPKKLGVDWTGPVNFTRSTQ